MSTANPRRQSSGIVNSSPRKIRSFDWSFVLRSGNDEGDDEDETEDCEDAVAQPSSDDLDISSRQDAAEFKSNPWSISKIRAAARTSKTTEKPMKLPANVAAPATAPMKQTNAHIPRAVKPKEQPSVQLEIHRVSQLPDRGNVTQESLKMPWARQRSGSLVQKTSPEAENGGVISCSLLRSSSLTMHMPLNISTPVAVENREAFNSKRWPTAAILASSQKSAETCLAGALPVPSRVTPRFQSSPLPPNITQVHENLDRCRPSSLSFTPPAPIKEPSPPSRVPIATPGQRSSLSTLLCGSSPLRGPSVERRFSSPSAPYPDPMNSSVLSTYLPNEFFSTTPIFGSHDERTNRGLAPTAINIRELVNNAARAPSPEKRLQNDSQLTEADAYYEPAFSSAPGSSATVVDPVEFKYPSQDLPSTPTRRKTLAKTSSSSTPGSSSSPLARMNRFRPINKHTVQVLRGSTWSDDEDTWSTLPARKPQPRQPSTSAFKSTGVFRLPTVTHGVGAQVVEVKRKVMMYKPPPLNGVKRAGGPTTTGSIKKARG